MLNRVWVAAIVVASLVPAPAFARGTKLLAVVQPADAETAVDAKRFALALGRALDHSERHQRVDLDVVAGGPEMLRAKREIEAASRKAKRGRDALYRLEVREAAQLLREAIATYKSNAAHLTEVEELGEALTHLGAILLHSNKAPQARKLLAEAVTLMPDLEAESQVFNPPMRRHFDEVKARVVATRGSLAISSSPAGALALVDGRVVGLTPVTVDDLHEGRHLVRVIDDGLVSWGRMVDVVAGAETQANARLDAPAKVPDLRQRIAAAYRAAASGEDVAAHVADVGRPLEVDQVFLSRVRRSDGKLVVDAALYGVTRTVRLARISRELPASGDLFPHARELLAELTPPALAILVGALRTPGARAELGRNAKRGLTEIVSSLGGTVSFLSTPLTAQCFNEPSCVQEAASSLNADGVLELEIKGTGKLKLRVRVLDGHTGKSLMADQVTVTTDGLQKSSALHGAVARAVDAVWEMHVAAGGETETAAVDAVLWEPSAKPAAEKEPDVMDAPVPEKAEPTNWNRVLGWTTASVGTAAAIGGLALALERDTVLADRDSSGAEKTDARRTGLFGVGTAIVGAGIAALGGWLTWDSYQD